MGQSQEYLNLTNELKELRRDVMLHTTDWSHSKMEAAIQRARQINKRLNEIICGENTTEKEEENGQNS